VGERAGLRVIACDRAPTEVLGAALDDAVLDARSGVGARSSGAARARSHAAWSQGDFGLAAARGARGVLLALEDATAPGHDLVHGEGDHARVVAQLRAARAAGLEVAITTTLTRSSARSTAALADLLVETRVIGWRLALVEPDDPEDAAARSPSLGICAPHVLRAADHAARGGVEIFFRALPRCLLGPFARWQPLVADEAAGVPCEACPSRVGCPGLSALHRARFGARELRPVSPTPEAPDTARRELAADLLAASSKTSAD
jgi:hypothetical protein